MFKKILLLIFLCIAGLIAVNYEKIEIIAECGNGDTNICLETGKTYLSKPESVIKLFIGISLLKKGCELNSRGCCAVLGDFLMKKEGTIDDAKTYLNKACNLRSQKACFALGMIYEEITKEKGKAIRAYKKSCDLGMKSSCEIVIK